SAHRFASCSRSCQLRPNRIMPPTSGCARRRRSSSDRERPVTSMITGACSLMVLLFLFHHHEAGGVIGFVRDAHLRTEAARLAPGLQLAVQHDHRLAAGELAHLAGAPRTNPIT